MAADPSRPNGRLVVHRQRERMTLAKTSAILLGELRQLIEQVRSRAAVAVNSELVLLYWQVGRRIRVDGCHRAERRVPARLQPAQPAQQGFGSPSASPTRRLCTQCGHNLSDPPPRAHRHRRPAERQFNTEMCRVERWATRTLKDKFDGMLW